MEWYTAIRRTLLPKDTNGSGTIFGGVILSEIDLAGAVAANRHIKQVAKEKNYRLYTFHHQFVTKAIQEVIFYAPAYVGDIITFATRVIEVGRTSITIEVRVSAEGDYGKERDITTAIITFVNVLAGKPSPLFCLEPEERS